MQGIEVVVVPSEPWRPAPISDGSVRTPVTSFSSTTMEIRSLYANGSKNPRRESSNVAVRDPFQEKDRNS